MKVMTVLGPVDAADLGRTLIHEHIFCVWPGSEYFPELHLDRDLVVKRAIVRLRELAEKGVRTFVDPCPQELGRDVTIFPEVSRATGINIICTTGFYHEGPGLPLMLRSLTAEQIADMYINEIENGVGDTGIRPGAIKCATSVVPTETEKKFLQAASIAHRKTGVPIITHTTGGQGGPEQQATFAEHGAQAHSCLIGHCCDNPDPAYHRQIVDGGNYIGFDRLGFPNPTPAVMADNIVKLVRDGFGKQVMMSQDRVCHFQGSSANLKKAEIPAELVDELGTAPWGQPYTYLFDEFIPLLRERGLTDEEIFPILDENPARFFAGKPF